MLQFNTDLYKQIRAYISVNSKIITGPCVDNTPIEVLSSYSLEEINRCLGFIGKPIDDMISPFSNDTELIHKGSRELD